MGSAEHGPGLLVTVAGLFLVLGVKYSRNFQPDNQAQMALELRARGAQLKLFQAQEKTGLRFTAGLNNTPRKCFGQFAQVKDFWMLPDRE